MAEKMIKTDSEIAEMIQAQAITDKAFAELKNKIVAGITEKKLAEVVDRSMYAFGASGIAFDTIVAFGENTANVHHEPTDRKLRDGDIIMFDIGAKYGEYCSDMSRTVFFGTPDEQFVKVYNLVLTAQSLALNKIKAGMKCCDADAIARDYLVLHGYGEQFCHTLGHGVGKVVHESPRLGPKDDNILEENMVVTVEPGLYIKGFGGVRIEDMVIVKNDGIINLTKTNKNFILNEEN